MTSANPPIQQVAAKAAIVNSKGQVLIVREASTGANNTKVGHFGLVGGRLDPGEGFLEGLKREVLEETGLSVSVHQPLYVGEWRPVIRGIEHQIIGIFMLGRAEGQQVRLSSEHDEYAWIDPAQRTQYTMMEPNCFVIDELAKLGVHRQQ